MTELTPSNFEGFVKEHRLAVVHFWAVWNGYDTEMKKFLLKHEPLLKGIAFATFDIDPPEYADFLRTHKLLNIPWIELYRDAVLLGSGVRGPRDVFLSELQNLAESP